MSHKALRLSSLPCIAMYKLPCRNLCGCTNFKNNDSQERVDGNEIFNNNDDFREY